MNHAVPRTGRAGNRNLTDEDIRQLVAVLVPPLAAAVADQLEPMRQPPPRLSRARLLAVIALAVQDRAFCAVEAIDHATVDARLRQALRLARIQTPKQLGRILAGIEKRPVPGWRLERLTVEHDGVVWRLLED